MNWKITWLLIAQTIGLGLGLMLHRRGHADAAFWVLAVALLVLGVWIVFDYILGLRVLRWLQKSDLRTPPRTGNLWHDFTDSALALQHRHTQEITQAQKRLTAFLDAIQALPIGVVLLNDLGRMEWFNLIAAEHFGFSNPRDLQQHIIHLVRDPQFVNYWLRTGSEQGVTIHGRNHTLNHPVRLSVQFFAFGDGKRLLLSHDITLQEQTDRMRRDFVSNVSHEIRTPLTVLSGFVETLQSIPLDADQTRRYLNLMAEQTQRMQVLVDDLLALSRLEGAAAPNASEPVDVLGLLQQCLHDAQSLSRILGGGQDAVHHFSMDFRIKADHRLIGSHSELHSAIGNLLGNAVRYTPAGGNISVEAAPTAEGGLRIAIRDTGPGIAREHLSRVTERFYRVDKSRSRETGGTGLGLAIVKHIAQRHGATLDIQSEVGHGSCFTLIFPAQRTDKTAPATIPAA